MACDLISYGVIPKKSCTKLFPDNIPSDLMRHYLRGYFDGNGSIIKSLSKSHLYYKLQFCTGSVNFANGLNNYINSALKIKTTGVFTDSTHENDYYVRIYKQSDVAKLLTYLYVDADTYLERKYISAQIALSSIKKR